MDSSEVFVEISPYCSFRCPDCNMQERLFLDNPRNYRNLAEKIIEHAPKNSYLYFVGLGEPTMPIGQKRIIKILESRPDIRGFIQTNGSFKLDEKIINFIKNKRLEVGMSYDDHHIEGQKIPVRIQKEYIQGLAISIKEIPKDFSIKKLKKEFPNIHRIVIEPLLNKIWDNPYLSWDKVAEFCKSIDKEDNSVLIYTEISKGWEGKAINNVLKNIKENGKEVLKDWHKVPGGAYYYIEDYRVSPRILTNGKVLQNSMRSSLPWKEIEDELIPLEDYFKQEVATIKSN